MALDDQTAWDTSDDTTAQGQQTQLSGGIVSPQGSMDINGLLRQVMAQQPVQLPQMPTRSASDGTSPGWLGLLGEALAGGQSPLYKLRGAQEDTAGSRALLNFGIGMMQASGPNIVRTPLASAFAAGLQGAQQSMDQSQQAAYTQAGQQFEQQRQLAALGLQQQNVDIKKLAAALPFLRVQQMGGIANPLAPNAPGTTAPGGYAGAIAGIEGPGKNPASTAQGVGQFTDATWNEFVQANPSVFAGMTPQQIQAARADPTIGTNAINWLAQRNAGALKNLGAPATGQSLGIAHFLGAGPAAAVMNAPDGMPVSAFVSPEAVKANPQLATMTVGQLKQRYANVPNPAFLGGTQYAGPGVPPAPSTTTPAPNAPAAPPSVQVGGAVPGPPGGPAGAATPYPVSGAGIGRVLTGTQGVVGSQPLTVRPPPSPADIRVSPTLRGDVTGGVPIASNAPIAPSVGPALPPSPAVAGDVQAMLAGVQNARPTLAGGTATAGPGAGGPAPVGGFGAIGDYNNAPAAAARPATPATPPVVPPAPTTATTPPATPPATGAKPSFEDWQAQHPIKIDPSLYTVTPPDLTDAIAAKNAAAQTLDLIHKGLSTADPNKATEAYNNAANNVARLQQEAQAKSLELQQSAQKNATDTQRQLYDAEMQRQAAVDLANVQSANKIKEQQASSDAQAGQQTLEAINQSRTGAKDTINNLEIAKQFSETAGQPSFLTQWPDVSNFLIRNNLLTPEEVKQLTAQKALDAVINKVTLSMRQGSGMSRMTNMDLQFLQNMTANSKTPEPARTAMFAAIQTAAQHQLQYADMVNSLHGSGMPVWQAQQQADQTIGSIIPTVPTMNPDGSPMSAADQSNWITGKVPLGTYYITAPQPGRKTGDLAIRGVSRQQ